MNRFPLVVVLIAALAAGFWVSRSRTLEPPALGPADGFDLPAVDSGRVAIGDVAPDFTLAARTGGIVTLSELRGRRIVLVFYRGHW